MSLDQRDIGRIVLFRVIQTQKTGAPHVEVPAIITAVKPGRLVDLTIFRCNGLDTVQATSVPYSDDLTKGWAQAWRYRPTDKL